ncbi:hypothetical protein HPP92_023373 [Vanilla planifolia]|uniref:Alpha-galactosidase n=1 Tax=Vanilla planifolia TaxID=51239 RepID=A0A835UG71_VANPL|nr:hypothetical protein HPP92_023373 [Vanilla planifolia]
MTAASSILLYCALILSSVLFKAFGQNEFLFTPVRGWNSYDSFSWIINEEEFLANAEVVSSKLRAFGYEYVVIDFLWYRKNVNGSSVDSYGYDSIDEWGRLVPDPERWPSSTNGQGFQQVSQKVHEMGLKFGIHLMGGISVESVNNNKTILDVTTGLPYEEGGKIWYAGDIGLTDMRCAWMKNGFMRVNTDLRAGRAFLRSLYQQYADWGVDFVKLDCVFGDDLDRKQIIAISEILKDLDRPMLISLSPGTNVNVSMAEGIKEYVDMYRITGDVWDNWNDIATHFDVARNFAAAKEIGAKGLHGNSWPDLDMLPLGLITDPGVRQGPHRRSKLTLDEQRTMLTLWSMAKSPLMFGGDTRQLDDLTFNLITNPTLLEINSNSANNAEFPHVFSGKISSIMHLPDSRSDLERQLQKNKPEKIMMGLTAMKADEAKLHSDVRSWIATGKRGEIYLSFFNLNPFSTRISANIGDLFKAVSGSFQTYRSCDCYEVWTGKDFGAVEGAISIAISSHGCALFILNCKP